MASALKTARRRLRIAWYRVRGKDEEAATWAGRMVPGMFRREEMRLLYRTARNAPGPGDIAEIGSWKGRTTILMGLGLRDAAVPLADCRVYAIDHHEGGSDLAELTARRGSSLQDFRENIRRSGIADRIEEMIMPAEEAAPILEKRGVQLRLLFIDGDHDESSVRADIRNFAPLVRAGGIIAFHDHDDAHPGVGKAISSELGGRVEVIDQASSLLVMRLRG